MPILGNMVRQAIILRVGNVIRVCTIKDPKIMVQDITYDNAFELDKIDDAFNEIYRNMLDTEQKA